VLKCRILSGIHMSNDRPDYRGNPLDFIGTLADVAGGLGDWVANGTPEAGSIAGEVQQRYRDHCDAWSNGPTWVQQFDPGARLFLSNACKPWLDSQGSGDPSASVPFTGGQCPGVEYDVAWVRRTDGAAQAGGTFTDDGPISLIDESFEEPDGEFTIRWRLTGATSETTINGGINRTGPRSRYTLDVTPTRTDGQPDDCGNPPPDIEPNPNPRPDPGLDPEDEPFEREPGQPVLPMPEIPDPFGDPVQLPNFPFPNVDGPTLYPEDEQPPQAEPGTPGAPETVSGDEEAEGQADEDEILTGVLVEVDSAPGFARTVQNVSVPTYIGACYVYLGWENQLDLQPEGQFLVNGQFFAAIPGMTHWRVRSAVGYTLTITPYYAPKE